MRVKIVAAARIIGRRKLPVFALAFAAATAFTLSAAHAANACTLITGNNWAAAYWSNAADDQGGGSYDTTVSPIGISGASSGNHINQTLWVGSDGTTDLAYWTELGYIKGFACDTTLEFYWADNRPNGGGFNKHLITSFTPVVGDTYGQMIDYVGSDTWNVVINETRVGQSTSNPGDSYSMQAGAETTTTANYLPDGDGNNLSHRVNGTWETYWGSGTTRYYTDYPCTQMNWVSGETDLDFTDSITSQSGC